MNCPSTYRTGGNGVVWMTSSTPLQEGPWRAVADQDPLLHRCLEAMIRAGKGLRSPLLSSRCNDLSWIGAAVEKEEATRAGAVIPWLGRVLQSRRS